MINSVKGEKFRESFGERFGPARFQRFRRRMNKDAVKKRFKHTLAQIFRYLLLISLGFVIISPLLSLLKDAGTEHSLLGVKNSVWIPQAVSSLSFRLADKILKYGKSLIYSIGNTLVLVILQVLCASMAAYSFARLKFRGSRILFGIVIFSIIVPSQSIMLAQYITFKNFDIFGLIKLITGKPINLVGSNIALYLLAATGMGIKGGLFIYILRQSIRQLPISIEEAAFVDGAGFLRTFFMIVIPSSRSALTSVGVLSFLWNYSDTYFISLLTNTNRHLALNFSRSQANMRWAIMDVVDYMPKELAALVNHDSPLVQGAVASACSLMVILPLLIMYLIVQRRFIQGVERSGLGSE